MLGNKNVRGKVVYCKPLSSKDHLNIENLRIYNNSYAFYFALYSMLGN